MNERFERVNVSGARRIVNDRKKVECKTDVLTESINKVLSVSAFTTIGKPEIEKGKATYVAKTTFYICYENGEGQISKTECGCEYKGELDLGDTVEDCKVNLRADVVRTEFDASQLKLSVIAYVEIQAETRNCLSLDLLCGGDDLICQTLERSYYKSLGERSLIFPIEEEFELSYPIGEVLFHRADAIITACQCGVNEIIVDGEVRLSVVLLQNDEKGGILKEERAFPFKAEIEFDDVNPSMQCSVNVNTRSFKIDVSVDTERNISALSVAVNLEFTGEVFSQENLVYAKDVFSLTHELAIEQKEDVIDCPLDERTIGVRISLLASADDIPENSTLKTVGGERAEIVSFKRKDDCIVAIGTLVATGYFINGEGRYFTRKIVAPFESTLDCLFDPMVAFQGGVKAENTSGRVLSNNEIELNAELIFSIRPYKTDTIKYVKGVALKESKTPNENAISVYIAREGESLWELAKRLNLSPEDIQNTNKDLVFPLSNKERIVVYRQK